MGRMNRRTGGVTAILMSMCFGLAGCMNTGGDDRVMSPPVARGYPPTQPTPANRSGYYAPMPTGAPTPGNIMTTPGGMMDPRIRPAGQTGQPGQPVMPEEVPIDPGAGVPQGPMGGIQPPIGGIQPQFGGIPSQVGAVPIPTSPPLPTELARTTHAPHRVAPPDILYIEALRMIPKGPYRLSAMEVLQIEVADTLPKQEIKGLYMISPEGGINLGHSYGNVRVGGLTVDQAQTAIRNHLSSIIKNANVNVALVQMRGMQNIKGEHLVRPDGTISLGMYGSVFVAGMTLGQVKCVIENHLAAYLVEPQVSVDVFAYNSRKIYIIADGAGYGQQVIALPATGGETVLDAISRVQGLPSVASLKKIWVSRPSPAGHPCSTVLPVDWKAITQAGRTETNYQLLPGDRIYIHSDALICAYNYIDKLVAPVERIMGVTFLGANLINIFRYGNNGNRGGGVVFVP